MTDLTSGAIDAAADLARRAADAQHIDNEVADLITRVVRRDEEIETVDLEWYAFEPRRRRGNATLVDPAHFTEYVTRLADEDATTVWADETNRRFTAVFNDHTTMTPGWRDHTATLSLRTDPDWTAWTGRDGKLTGQADFAEFLEDNLAAIVDPPAADMLEVATTFQARRNAQFEQGVRLTSGDVQLRWAEDTTAKAGARGHLEVPDRFTIRVAPFVGVEPVDLIARLRWRIRDGALGIGFRLHRPDVVEREAFDSIRAFVNDALAAPVLLGTAPTARP